MTTEAERSVRRLMGSLRLRDWQNVPMEEWPWKLRVRAKNRLRKKYERWA